MKPRSPITLVVVLCAVIASPAFAQEMSSSTGEVGRVSVNSDEAIPVGPFIFSPVLQLAWQDRDNIFFTPDNEVADQLVIVRAGLLFEVPIYESYLSFSYTPQYRDYKDYELEDKWSHFFNVAGAFEFASGFTLTWHTVTSSAISRPARSTPVASCSLVIVVSTSSGQGSAATTGSPTEMASSSPCRGRTWNTKIPSFSTTTTG